MALLASEHGAAGIAVGRHIRHAAGGLICGLLAVVQSIGFATLLLSEGGQSFAPAMVGMALFSTAILAAIAPFASSNSGVVIAAQGIPIAALAGLVGSIVAAMTGRPFEAMLVTIVVAVGLSTLAIGAVSLLIGGFRLGRFVRFVPFPVIGGFLAGSGWLIFAGGLAVVAGGPVRIGDLGVLLSGDTPVRAATALLIVLAVGLLRLRFSVSLALPTVALAAVFAFNLAVFVAGADTGGLQESGWLVAMTEGVALWPPVGIGDLGQVEWSAILLALVHLPTVVVLSVVALLMNATGIELDARRDLDLDRELRTVGIGNLLGGVGGGMPGFHSVTLTLLAARLGAGGPLVGLTVAALCAIALFFGDLVLSLVPTPLLGGFLLLVGGSLLREWLIRSRARLSLVEYLVVVLIFMVIVAVGFAWGILLGLIAAAALFVFEYGRIEIVRHVMTGRDYQSGNDASEERREILRGAGDAILILRLQGFIFFGTAERLRRQIEDRLARHEGAPVRFMVIDFRRVSGLDSSTVLSFIRLAQVAEPDGFTLMLTGMNDAIRAAMERGGLEFGGVVRAWEDFDHGLEWCENALLNEIAPRLIGDQPVRAGDLLNDIVKERHLAEALLACLERIEIAVGERLIEQGRPSDDIYFIESGRAAVELQGVGHRSIRVATVGRGAIVGEVAFYLGKPRSASVVAETALVAWRFSAASLETLRATSPEAVIAFHRGMAGMLADRLTATNRLVRLLAD